MKDQYYLMHSECVVHPHNSDIKSYIVNIWLYVMATKVQFYNLLPQILYRLKFNGR